MSNPAPITLQQLIRHKKPWGELPHQDAAIVELEADILTVGYAVAMRRDRPWFKTWSTDGEQLDPVELALPLIKEFEGCRLTAYPDPGTGGEPWTIGWGSTSYASGSRVMPGDTITQARADQLLEARVRQDELQLAKTIPAWASMTAHQRAALLSFTYNVGSNWYGSSGFNTITARVMDAQFDRVPDALMLYVNPGTPVEAGLRRRRDAEGRLWASPPKLAVPAQQQPAKPIKVRPYLMLTRTGKVDARGLELLRLQKFVDGIPMAELSVVSGAPGRQNFRRGVDSKAGSLEPLPEGRWIVDDIAWKAGADNYRASWGAGLGPASVPLRYDGPGETQRSAIEIHYDENHGTSPGTAGCIGIRSIQDLQRLVVMLRAHDPRLLYVDWRLGSCPPVSQA